MTNLSIKIVKENIEMNVTVNNVSADNYAETIDLVTGINIIFNNCIILTQLHQDEMLKKLQLYKNEKGKIGNLIRKNIEILSQKNLRKPYLLSVPIAEFLMQEQLRNPY